MSMLTSVQRTFCVLLPLVLSGPASVSTALDWSPAERKARREKRLREFFPDKTAVPKVLLLVPGHGEAERWPWISDTLNKIAGEWRNAFGHLFDEVSASGSGSSASRSAFRDPFPNLGCVVYLYKSESAYSIEKATEKDRRLGNFTSTHCEVRRRIRVNWTGFLQLSAEPDPAVRQGRLDTEVSSDNATALVSSFGGMKTLVADGGGVGVSSSPPSTVVSAAAQRYLVAEREAFLGNQVAGKEASRLTTKYVKVGPVKFGHARTETVTLPLIAGFDYVLAILDDISVEGFDIKEFLGLMKHNQLQVATPFVYLAPGSNFIKQSILDAVGEEDERFAAHTAGYRAENHMSVVSKNALFGSLYRRGIAGTRLRAWEVQMTMFRTDAFYCWANMVDPGVNPIGWGYDMLYYDLCKHANSIGFVSGPRSEVFHLAERFLQGLSSNRYVMDDETKPQFVKVGDLGRLNDHGAGGALDQEMKERREEARKRALERSRASAAGAAGDTSTISDEADHEEQESPGSHSSGVTAGDVLQEAAAKGDGSFHGIHGMPDYAINAPKESFIEVIGQYQIAEAMMENWLEKKKIVPYWLKNETSSTEESSSSSEEGEGGGRGGVGEGSAGGAEGGEEGIGGVRDSGVREEGKKQAQQKSSVEARLSSALQDSGMEEKGFVMKSCLVALEDDLLYWRPPTEEDLLEEASNTAPRGEIASKTKN